MRHHHYIVIVCVSLLLPACSIHPQTEDFSRTAVPDIVHAIKCEAKQAIADTVRPEEQYLMGTGLGLAFYFELSEANDRGSEGTFSFPVAQGTFKIGYDVGIDKKRKSTQQLSTADTFKMLSQIRCDGDGKRRNFMYPITGNIGLSTTFMNYVDMMRQHAKAGSMTQFSDEVQFTTDIGATLTPSIDLKPLSGNLIDAKAILSDSRTDVHRVTVSFTPPLNSRQQAIADAKSARDRDAELARIREENDIPTRVQIVDGNGRGITPKEALKERMGEAAPGGTPEAMSPGGPSTTRDKLARKAVRTVSPPASDILDRTQEDLDRVQTKAFQERFTREFNR